MDEKTVESVAEAISDALGGFLVEGGKGDLARCLNLAARDAIDAYEKAVGQSANIRELELTVSLYETYIAGMDPARLGHAKQMVKEGLAR